MIEIIKYQQKHQIGIDELLRSISLEFENGIYTKETEQTPLVPDVYWVALINNDVIGTVGLSLVNNYAILKRMFLKKEYRGKNIGLSTKLLTTALTYCCSNNISELYLGTMHQFKAGQRFYIKHGFERVVADDLPRDFMLNPLDNMFFKKHIIT